MYEKQLVLILSLHAISRFGYEFHLLPSARQNDIQCHGNCYPAIRLSLQEHLLSVTVKF